jgi:hypothetical protein
VYYMATTVLAVILGIILVISIHPGVVGQEKVGLSHTLIKKKIKFSSFLKKFRVEHMQIHAYMRKGFLIYEEMRNYFPMRRP